MIRSQYLSQIAISNQDYATREEISSTLYNAFRESAHAVMLAKPQPPIEQQIAEARAELTSSPLLKGDKEFFAVLEPVLKDDEAARQFVQQAHADQADMAACGSANHFVHMVSTDIRVARGMDDRSETVNVTEQELRPGAFAEPSSAWKKICANIGRLYKIEPAEADRIVCTAFAKLSEAGNDVMLSHNLRATHATIQSAIAKPFNQS